MSNDLGTTWQFDVPTNGSKQLPPDPRYVEGLSSQGYSFEAAVADLVDNSIDAGAKDVLIHFLRDGDQLVSLVVVDDGCGMDDGALDTAMTVGGQQQYSSSALGMFGTGLKSASLSSAESFTVVGKTKRSRATGRRLAAAGVKDGFRCDIVAPDYAQDLVDFYYDRPIKWQGTVVRWDGVKDFPKTGGGGQTDRYLARTVQLLGLHLGLTLHRFLERADFNITIAVQDVRSQAVYESNAVLPLDPFGYPVSGKAGYPRAYFAPVVGLGKDVQLVAHIWPPKSQLDGFRRLGGTLQQRQGFYFYRNDRLVQAGGWNNYRQPEGHLSAARIVVELPSGPRGADLFRLTVKKDGVVTSPAFVQALEKAAATNGHAFQSYLDDAEFVYREAGRRSSTVRKAAIHPGKGLPPEVKRTISEELPQAPAEEPVAIRWEPLPSDTFFDIDRENRVLRLNRQYRNVINGGRRGGMNDAPLVKSLLYLLVHELYQGEHLGSRQRDNLALWQSVLLSAARSELDRIADDADR